MPLLTSEATQPRRNDGAGRHYGGRLAGRYWPLHEPTKGSTTPTQFGGTDRRANIDINPGTEIRVAFSAYIARSNADKDQSNPATIRAARAETPASLSRRPARI